MTTETKPSRGALIMLWTGRVLSGLVVAALLASGVMKFLGGPEMEKGMEHLGWPVKLAIALGILEITVTIIYAVPQTSIVGAILIAGYMGGAIATHVRVGDPFIFQIVIGLIAWLGIYLREPRLWKLIPLRRTA